MTEDRFSLYRLCDCPACEGRGYQPFVVPRTRCDECRGEGRIRQEVATAQTAEAVGVALVTLACEGEWEECQFGLLDRMPKCLRCDGSGRRWDGGIPRLIGRCEECDGSGVKPTGTWLVLPYPSTARTVSAAARLLRSRQQ